MQTCRASPLGSSLVSSSRLHNAQYKRALIPRQICSIGLRRQASTAVPSPLNKPPPEEASFRSRTKTILHKVEAFVPRVLADSNGSPGPASLAFWKDVLNGAYLDLNSAAKREHARVVGTHTVHTKLIAAKYCAQYMGTTNTRAQDNSSRLYWKSPSRRHLGTRPFGSGGKVRMRRVPSFSRECTPYSDDLSNTSLQTRFHSVRGEKSSPNTFELVATIHGTC